MDSLELIIMMSASVVTMHGDTGGGRGGGQRIVLNTTKRPAMVLGKYSNRIVNCEVVLTFWSG